GDRTQAGGGQRQHSRRLSAASMGVSGEVGGGGGRPWHSARRTKNRGKIPPEQPESPPPFRTVRPCSYFHVPYHHRKAPFADMRLVPCGMCGRKWVAETVLSTVEAPENLISRGEGCLVEARVCRVHRRQGTSELEAIRVSEALPFMEYELQRQLMLKLKCLGVNAAFSLRSDIQLGPRLMVGSISATAVYVESLPTPPQLVVARPPRSLHQDGGGGGDAQRRVLALASRVERIGAVNRQRLQALAPRRRRLRGRRKKRSSTSSSRGAVNGGRAGDSESSFAATSAAGQHQQHQQHPQPQPSSARNQQSRPPGGVRSLPTLPGGVGDGDGRRRSGDSGSVAAGGDGGSTMT
ncbi:unnamed protein product, partial [Ectocarpus sp. 12 AP-2014]